MKQKLLCALLILLGAFVTILPWEVIAYRNTNKIIPVSSNGPISIVGGLTYALDSGPKGDKSSVPESVKLLMEKIRSKETRLNSTGKVAEFLLSELIENPVPVIQLIFIKSARAWYGTSAMWYEDYILVLQIIYLITIIIGIAAAIKRKIPGRQAMVFLLVLVLYFWGMTTVAKSILRYMVPAMGLLLVFSAVAIDSFLTKNPE